LSERFCSLYKKRLITINDKRVKEITKCGAHIFFGKEKIMKVIFIGSQKHLNT